MQEILTDLTQWIQMLHPSWIVLIVSLIAYLENVIPPIPGDLVVVFAGFMASDGIIRIAPVYLGSTFASVAGFISMYYVGVYLRGKSVLLNDPTSFWRKILNPRHLKKSRRWMSRWGQWVIVGNRFLAGTRSVIAITAGYSRTHLLITSISSLISSLLWNGVLLFAGYLIHENWLLIGEYLSIYSRIILALLVVVTVVVFIIKRRRRQTALSNQK
jgi:membrane protein DedA with SNARE-associated domain